jgi:hypothetical protein
MKKPNKYFIICDKTKRLLLETDREPITNDLCTWEPSCVPGQSILTQTKTAYIDTRYEAKMRLYKYMRSKKYYPGDILIFTMHNGEKFKVNFRGYVNETQAVVWGERGSGLNQVQVNINQLSL